MPRGATSAGGVELPVRGVILFPDEKLSFCLAGLERTFHRTKPALQSRFFGDGMNACELISVFSAAVVLILLLAVASAPAQGRHFYAYAQCQRVIDKNGLEREHSSLATFRANTLIGRTVGRIYIALAHLRFARMKRAGTVGR